MAASRLFPRGFALLRTGDALEVPTGWLTLALQGSGWFFSHDPAVEPSLAVGEDGEWVLSYGLLLYAGDDVRELTPSERLVEALGRSEEAFLEQLDLYGGRYIILRGGPGDRAPVLYQDATGMRTVHFSETADVVASHVELVNRLQPHPLRTPEQGLASFLTMWGRTPRLGVEALLPNHSLELGTWSIERFYPRRENPYAHLSVQERVDLFRTRWERMMRDLVALDARLIMSITGGWDSRTGLALSLEHLDRLALFTYSTKATVTRKSTKLQRSLVRDRTLVEQLLQLIPPVSHTYFYTDEPKLRLTPGQREHMATNALVKHGRWLLPHYLQAFPEDNVIHLRGNAAAVGKSPWTRKRDEDSFEALEQERSIRTGKDDSDIPDAQRQEDFRAGYERWGYDGDLHGLHRKDLFYWEVRLGRWSAEICNETDIAFETCATMNVRALLELTLSFPLEQRHSSFFYSELINSAAPPLNFPGFNDYRNLYEVTRDKRGDGAGSPTGLPLQDHLEISGPQGHEQLPAKGAQLIIPQEHFLPASAVHRVFEPTAQDGELRFTLSSTYGYAAAAGHWRCQVWVDGRMHTSWDGGISKAPVHVTVTDLRAGSIVSVAVMALVDRHATASWSNASRAQIEDIVFEAKDPAGQTCVALDAPRATRPQYNADPPRLAPADLGALPAEFFPLDEPTRLDVDLGGCLVPLLVVRREPTEDARVITLFNGAVDLERSQGHPVFQRSTWWQDIPWSQIYVADPGTIGPEALSLAWGQVSRDVTAVPATVEAVRLLASVLGAQSAEQRTYFGSSAGGFWAWSAAILDTGSRAVVNNAQIDWTRWMAGAVNELRAARFDGILPATIRSQYPTRTSVLQLWKHRKKPARIDYWVNVASDHDRVVDLPQVESFMREHPTLTEGLCIHHYEDAVAGHNPMVKADVLRAVRAADAGSAVPRGNPKGAPGRHVAETVEDLPELRWRQSEVPDFLNTAASVRHTIADPSGASLPMNSLLLRRDASDTLVVPLHGTLDRKKHGLPYFERFQEFRDLPHHVLFLADPTLYASPNLRVGWYAGTTEEVVPERIAGMIQEAARQLGASKVILTGASAGGFAALSLAPRIKDSLAVAFSPQTDIRPYAQGGPAKTLIESAFPGYDTVADLARDQPGRVDLSSLYRQYTGGRAWFIQNTGDEPNMRKHMIPFQNVTGDRVAFVLEHHCKGTNPPTPRRIRSWIDYACSHFDGDPQANRLQVRAEGQP